MSSPITTETLKMNIAMFLDIPYIDVDKPDFFETDCELCDYSVDIKQSRHGKKPFDESVYASYELSPEERELCDSISNKSCLCSIDIRWNYFVHHKPTNKIFRLGSQCIRRFDPNAFKKKCNESDCDQFCKTKRHSFCDSHSPACSYCGKKHMNGLDCKKRRDRLSHQCPSCHDRKNTKALMCRACFYRSRIPSQYAF